MEYTLSMNINAFGTFLSPKWMTELPTQYPAFCCARCKIECMDFETAGHICTLFKPCPVSLNLYELYSDNKS